MLQRIGCGIWLALFLGLPLFGAANALKYSVSTWIGWSWGAAAFLVAFSGYMVALAATDWLQGRKYQPEFDVPRWVVPVTWCVFVVAGGTCVWLSLRLFTT